MTRTHKLNRLSCAVLEDAMSKWFQDGPAQLAAAWREEFGERADAQLAEQLQADYYSLHGGPIYGADGELATALSRAGLARVNWPEVARRLLAWAERQWSAF
jgi:hypothetical protein